MNGLLAVIPEIIQENNSKFLAINGTPSNKIESVTINDLNF